MDRELIRAGRGLLGWSQTELAERAGVRRRVVAAYESGERSPQRRNLDRLSAALKAAGVEQVKRDDGAIGIFINSAALAQVRARNSMPSPAELDDRKTRTKAEDQQ